MSELLLRAELQKLALTLNAPVADLAFLSNLEMATLRELRHAISASLFDRHARRFKRLADSSKLLPNKLVAIISEKAIPASLSAQVTGLLTPAAAVDLAGRLPLGYQADICVAMDPRRALPVLQAMPASHVVQVAMEMLKRRDFMTMARFVDALTEEQISRVSQRMNAEGLLRVGFYVESPERLDQLISLLSLEQLDGVMVAAAAEDGGLWPEVFSLAERLGPLQGGRIGNLMASTTPAVLASLNTALFERDLWRAALPLLEVMNDAAQEIVIASLASHAEQNSDEDQNVEAFLSSLSDGLRSKVQIALGRA
jgi:hypothetical protein